MGHMGHNLNVPTGGSFLPAVDDLRSYGAQITHTTDGDLRVSFLPDLAELRVHDLLAEMTRPADELDGAR